MFPCTKKKVDEGGRHAGYPTNELSVFGDPGALVPRQVVPKSGGISPSSTRHEDYIYRNEGTYKQHGGVARYP